MPRIGAEDALRERQHDGAGDPYGLGPYEALLFSDTGGLTQFGAFLETLPPGSRSSRLHWHENEDEFVYMVAGEVELVEDDSRTPLRPGDAATFRAGVPVAHHLHNTGQAPATYLVVGTRAGRDRIHYGDDGSTVDRDGRKRIVRDVRGQVVREYER